MDSSPFTAKVGKVTQKTGLDQPQLALSEPDGAQQPHLTQVTEQFKARVLLRPDDMNVRRKVIVGKDHYAQALENGENRRRKPA